MENLTVYVKETYFYFLSKIPSVEELVLGGLKKMKQEDPFILSYQVVSPIVLSFEDEKCYPFP